nr:hypothetical protein Itr_chr07CG08700 [Ipomoea trifida]
MAATWCLPAGIGLKEKGGATTVTCYNHRSDSRTSRRSPLLSSRSETPETEEKAAARRPAVPTRRRKNRRREARTGVALPASFAVVAAVTYRPARRRDGHRWFNVTPPEKQGRSA